MKKNTWKPGKSKYDVELTAFEEEAVKGLYGGKPLIGEGGILTEMIARIVRSLP